MMEDWETDYMKELAEIATSKGGTILEVGYGMGISAGFIQKSNIQNHIVIEANHEVVEKANKEKYSHPFQIIEGFWQEAVTNISNESIDGILFDTYPLSELEIHKNHFEFFKTAFEKLKKGGILTYYSDEISDFSEEHLQELLDAGFKKENIKKKIIPVNPPENCQYWKSKTILAPIITK